MPSAPAPLRDTRERIVEAARYLFWERGYAATGLAEILARAKANSGSFYHFFESKDDLLRTVLDTYVELLEPYVIRPAWGQTADPIERIFALLEGYRQRLVDTGSQYGCPIGRLALEIDPENTPAHELIARNFAAWRGHVEACVRTADVPEPGDTAALVLAVMEGAVMQSRAERSLAPFDACIRRLRAHFDQLTSARPTRRVRSSKRTP
jgi:AcrR family transcriptional regulator